MGKHNWGKNPNSQDNLTRWDNGVNVKEPVIRIAQDFQSLIKNMCIKVNEKHKGDEFAFVCKGVTTNKGFELKQEILVPTQEVKYASVDIIDHPSSEWNVFFHRHPSSVSSFSVDDHESINKNYDCSILLDPDGNIIDNRLRLKVSDSLYFMVKATIETPIEIPADIFNAIERNIRDHVYTAPSTVAYDKPKLTKDRPEQFLSALLDAETKQYLFDNYQYYPASGIWIRKDSKSPKTDKDAKIDLAIREWNSDKAAEDLLNQQEDLLNQQEDLFNKQYGRDGY